MTKSRYPYAPDEFDAPAPQGAPVGVHRTPRSGWSRTWPFLLVAVVFAGLALGGVAFLANGGMDTPFAGSTPSQEETTPDGGESPQETEEPPAEETEEPPADTEEPPADETEEPTDEPEETPAGDVELAADVRVLNGAGVNGLASAGAEVLTGAGFTSVQAVNYEGEPLAASTVWYQAPEFEATARDVAQRLGIDSVELVPANRAAVSVILMSDFR